ncbi:hypothetical protein F2Q68_00011617 [Brassica cretica]|uniref:Uncharacterized protein n=1 Tax=Brassica cretica TaxID=69181 RepID=A0A8S9KXJ9_BRACR|nr:hypothetical protein F2Q68_00011617 [Brassica cretica]
MCVLVWRLACIPVMQPDIWEWWWRPACVPDMQPEMWSTRCHRACVRSHAKRHTGCHQPEADWLVSPINTPRPQIISSHPDLSKATPKEGSVQLKINQMKIRSDGNEVNMARERERKKVVDVEYDHSVPLMIKWRCCTRLVQFHGFRSVEVLLDAPPVSPKNCPEAREGSVRVKISLSRPVSFFMVKPRLCPRQDQSRPVQSSHPLGLGQVFSDQPAAYRQRTLGFKENPYSPDREHSERRGQGLWLSGYMDGVVTGSDPTVLGLSRGDPTVMCAAIIV